FSLKIKMNQSIPSDQTIKVDESLYQVKNRAGRNFLSPVASAFKFDPSRHVRFSLSPVTSVTPGLFTSTSPIQFRIPRGYCGDCKMIFINLNVKEGGGSNL